MRPFLVIVHSDDGPVALLVDEIGDVERVPEPRPCRGCRGTHPGMGPGQPAALVRWRRRRRLHVDRRDDQRNPITCSSCWT
jgi:hypothetical protein